MLAYEWNEDEAHEAWKEEGYDIGYDKANEATAISMLNDGVEPKFISKWTKLPLSRVLEIKASLKK